MRFFPRYDGPPLMGQITSVENLTLAWQRVRSNIKLALRRRSAGIDAVTLHDFETDWTRQMTTLAEELQTGAYRPLPARRVAIPKRSGGERAIAILAVRDRVAQRAVQQTLDPLFDPLLLDCAYGCRRGVGVPQAIERVQRYVDHGFTWVVDGDIRDSFDTIDQRIVLGLLRQRIDDPAVLRIIAQWLHSGTLQTAETERVGPSPSLTGRAREALQRLLDREEVADVDGATIDVGMDWPGADGEAQGGWEQRIWTAVMLARPALRGAQAALPYARRIGGRRIAVAAGGAAGAVALGDVALRQWAVTGGGAPQGGALSPLLANIYLHPFDLALTTHGFRLVRFVDDFVILCSTEDEAQAALRFAERQLAQLRLSLNADKTRVLPYADGLDFLGHAFVSRQAGAASFAEAEQRLRDAAGVVRQRWKRR